MAKGDVNHVLMFSDRPFSIARYITSEQLASSWAVGENSFKADPPNAALIINGHVYHGEL